jgi:hypothetical protein
MGPRERAREGSGDEVPRSKKMMLLWQVQDVGDNNTVP